MTLPNARSGSRSTDLYTDLREIIDDALSETIDTSLAKTLERVAVAASVMLHSRFVAVVLRDRDGSIDTLLVRGAAQPSVDPLHTLTGLAARVVYDGVTVRVPDIALQPLPIGLPVEPDDEVREVLGVPVRSGGKIIGGLFVAAREDHRPYRREDEQEARALATGIGFLVDHQRMNESIARRERWLQASVEFGRELVADTHANPLQMLVERILTLADADLATVVVPATDPAKMIIASAAGERADELDDRVLDRSGSVHDMVFDEMEPLIVDLRGATAHRELIDVLGLATALLVPMPALPGLGGVLALYRHAGRAPFTRSEIEMATTLGAQIVLAMELAGTRADRERGALLAERDRIARDLHDTIIQQLFATGMTLQSVAGSLGNADSERVHRAVDELDQTILQIRSTIYRLTTPTFGQDSGLRHSIDQVITRLEEAIGFPVDLDVSGPVDLGVADDVGQDIIAVLQETLTNVAKHAEASSARVSLTLRSNIVTLVVADNGKGLGMSSRRSGLANLRARAEALDGTMNVESDATGTRITWSVPAGS